MAQLFPRRANVIARVTLIVIALGAITALSLLLYYPRSDAMRQVGPAEAPVQPVPFSHVLHVQTLKINCQFCHTGVEVSSNAALPQTQTCMGCHTFVKTDSPKLQPVRDSFTQNKPVAWERVYDLPDFVYFNHSIHVNKGFGCSTCHGAVQTMGGGANPGETRMYRNQALTMEWCLSCHTAPEKNIRPESEIYNMDWKPGPDQVAKGTDLIKANHIRVERLTDCSLCHR